tara:strand:- start:635 stop:2863 length:2229 start_codon:yes stop_codon:yes gene_type:complete
MAKRYEIELKFSSPGAKQLRKALDSLAAAQNRLAQKQSKLNVQSKMAENVTQKMIQSQEKHRVALAKSRVQIVQLQKRIEQLNLKNKLLKQRIDKTTGSFGRLRLATAGLQRRLGAIRNTMLLFTFAFGAALNAVRGFIQTSMQFEAVKVRLNAMFGSVERGTAAFETFNEVAATTPFTLTDVVEAGAALKAFGTNAEEMIKPTADLAAFMGVTATEAAQALGRAFAGGAGAADILRERGILQLVRDFKGLDDLSKLTLPEFRDALTDTLLDPASGIAGATDALSKTMTGMVSNLADAVTRMGAGIGDLINFRGAIQGMTGFFSTFADFLKEVNKTDIERIEELQRALGIEQSPTKGLEETIDALNLRIFTLKESLLPTRNLSIAEQELLDAQREELRLLKELKILKDGDLSINKILIEQTEIDISRSRAKKNALQEEVNAFKSLAKAEDDLVFKSLELDVANRDVIKSFEEQLELLDSIPFKDPVDLGLSIRMPETGIQAFSDDLARQISEIDKERLNRAFEESLNFDEMFRQQLVGGFMNSLNELLNLQKANLDQRVDNEIKALKKTDKFRNASIEQRQTMEDDIRAKFAKEQRRIFKLQKAMSIAQVIIDTNEAINKLMQQSLAASLFDKSAPIRAKAITGGMLALSAAQIALISQQQAPAFARGGSFVTQGKQMIMVGDNPGGRERVDITPLSTPDFGDAGGGASINVNIMGNVIGTQEFVRDNLLPEIENSIRRNLA